MEWRYGQCSECCSCATLCHCFSQLGWMERTHVLKPIAPKQPVAVEDFKRKIPESWAMLKGQKPLREAQDFLMGECIKDRDRGFASDLFTEEEGNRTTEGAADLLVSMTSSGGVGAKMGLSPGRLISRATSLLR